MVRFVVEHENVLLAADLASQHAIHQRGIALDIAHGLDFDLLESSRLVLLFLKHFQQPSRHLPFVVLQAQVTGATRRGALRANADGLFYSDGHSGLDDLAARSSRLHTLRLEHVPVSHQYFALRH